MDIKHGYQPKEPLHKRPLRMEDAREEGREAARKDVMRLATKLLWLQAAVSAIALILSIVALLLRL